MSVEKWCKMYIFMSCYCLRWFQYQLLYRLRRTGHFPNLRKLVDSPRFTLCKHADETILHMFCDCPKIQDYWLDVQNWISNSFTHCNNCNFHTLYLAVKRILLLIDLWTYSYLWENIKFLLQKLGECSTYEYTYYED